MNIAICWLGKNDIELIKSPTPDGPIFLFYNSHYMENIDKLYIISSHPTIENEAFISKLSQDKVEIIQVELKNPTEYDGIYNCTVKSLEKIKTGITEKINWSFFISSGTSQMSTMWVLLSQTEYEATLYQTELESNKYVIKTPVIPFSIKTEYIANFLKKSETITDDRWKDMPGFTEILYQSECMHEVLNIVYLTALHEIPALILGETGTGKELIARAIHSNSVRKNKPFSIINCAALPENIVESLLFGYSKGAFTGAISDSQGIFEQINNGTLFLDEIGDLSLNIQVKILRVLETGEFQRIGDMKTIRTNIRLICATNKNVYKMIQNNTFREDLYYRISTSVINLPPLRSRDMDCVFIAKEFIRIINKELTTQSNIYTQKKLTDEAYRFIGEYTWPGNVRELYHTLKRCCIFTLTDEISEKHLRSSINILTSQSKTKQLPLNLEKHLSSIKNKYIKDALTKANGNKTKAAKLLGYKNYQSIDYFYKKIKL